MAQRIGINAGFTPADMQLIEILVQACLRQSQVLPRAA
jgi:hypothetical protein